MLVQHYMSILDQLMSASEQSSENTIWNRETSLPEAFQGHTGVAANNHIFVKGRLEGFTENRRAICSNDVFSAEKKDSHLSEWKRKESFPHPLGYRSAVTKSLRKSNHHILKRRVNTLSTPGREETLIVPL